MGVDVAGIEQPVWKSLVRSACFVARTPARCLVSGYPAEVDAGAAVRADLLQFAAIGLHHRHFTSVRNVQNAALSVETHADRLRKVTGNGLYVGARHRILTVRHVHA